MSGFLPVIGTAYRIRRAQGYKDTLVTLAAPINPEHCPYCGELRDQIPCPNCGGPALAEADHCCTSPKHPKCVLALRLVAEIMDEIIQEDRNAALGWIVSVCLACGVPYWAEPASTRNDPCGDAGDKLSHGLCSDACKAVYIQAHA